MARTLRRLLDEDLGTVPSTVSLPSGIADLDLLLTGGFGRGQVSAIAGEPGAGASMLALDVARRTAVGRGVPTAVLAPDAPLAELVTRIVSSETAVPLSRLGVGGLRPEEKERITTARARLEQAPLWVQVGFSVRMTTPRALETAGYLLEAGARLLLLDGTSPMEPEVRELVIGLRVLAHRHRAAVVLVTSARAPADPSEPAQLRDLREHDAVSDLVDVVLVLRRTDAGTGEVIGTLVKNRFGPEDSLRLHLAGYRARFSPLASGGR